MDYVQQFADLEDTIDNLEACREGAFFCGCLDGVDLIDTALESMRADLEALRPLRDAQLEQEEREMNMEYERMVL